MGIFAACEKSHSDKKPKEAVPGGRRSRLRAHAGTLTPSLLGCDAKTRLKLPIRERLKGRTEPLRDRPVHPFGRRGQIADVVNAMVFLASDESSFIAGTDLAVDGGWTAGKVEPGAPTG